VSQPSEFTSFVEVARSYCATIESAATVDLDLSTTRRQLAELLATGLNLPIVDPTDDNSPSVAHERWTVVFRSLQRALGDRDFYATTFDPYEDDAEISTGSLADDLADIWRDLREGLDALVVGSSWQDAAWEWRFGLDTHWGKHAVEALRALHGT